ncbi:OmpA family protein [Neisseria dentiae]|uniref:OmpA family protein n=1 Tax=Neisseria dentiae TaxID=194197 RepID=UPI00211C7C3D|nr:OmpA family protein [Neisseria dentiae]MCQ9327142.1 OmpA family protein [Neisseria dentiae]
MSFDLGSLLQGQLGGVLSRFLTQNGESAENSTKAAGLAVPAVVAGLLKHVGGNPDNAAGLFELVKGSAGGPLNNAVAQAEEGGSGLDGLIDWGKAKLPELLGGNAADVSDQIAQESGVSKATAGSLLSLSLPLVLSVLRGKVQGDNLSQGQLLGLLGQQQSWLSGALSGGMLSALGISSLSGLFGSLSGLAGGIGHAASAAAGGAAAATAAAASKGSGLGKWIALVIAALLALFAYKSCGTQSGQTGPASASDASAPVAAEAASEPEGAAVSAVMPSEPSAVSDTAASTPAPAAASEASAPAIDPNNAHVSYDNGVAKFYFATAKTDVAEGAETVVAEVIAAGKEGKKLVISGFADSTGNAAANEKLSKDRANAVKAFFEAQGVDAANIELRKPENTTGAVGNDAEGRRVEVKVEG